jgi:beta-N-acetylhexosaminidase
VVLAFAAPYYLDTTEVSKLTAYYGVYSRTEPFVDAAVRALFQEFVPSGRSPVTVEGVDYDLAEVLSPDPNQEISVDRIDEPAPGEGTSEPIKLDVGDSLTVRTGVIVDRNGNPVPDGTPVNFRAYYVQEQLERAQTVVTLNGVAEATITLEMAGQIEIRATSDPATSSRPLVVIMGETTVFITPTPTLTPTPTPTLTPTPTPTLTPTPTPTLTPTPTPTPIPRVVPPPPPEPRVYWTDLLLALAGIVVAILASVIIVRGLGIYAEPARLIRMGLWCGVCGLVGYLFYGLGLPGTAPLESVIPGVRGLLIGFLGALLPLPVVIGISESARRFRRPAGS